MKVGVIVETRYLSQDMPGLVIKELKARGYSVDVINPDGGYLAVDDGVFIDTKRQKYRLFDYDMIISRNRNSLGLALLYYAEELGIPTINTHRSIQKVRNKAKMGVSLAVAGIKTAPTALASSVGELSPHFEKQYPIILKAIYGDNCQGLQLVRDGGELAELDWESDLVLAQRYCPNDGYDLKLYACGEYVFPVRKPSPFNGNIQAPLIPVELSADLQALAQKCGELFGLDLYGVDCIETADGPLVIEVNDYPNYSGIPNISGLIADHILANENPKGG